jgi:hypothetical protein
LLHEIAERFGALRGFGLEYREQITEADLVHMSTGIYSFKIFKNCSSAFRKIITIIP